MLYSNPENATFLGIFPPAIQLYNTQENNTPRQMVANFAQKHSNELETKRVKIKLSFEFKEKMALFMILEATAMTLIHLLIKIIKEKK